GQGHETSFAQLVSEWLGVPFGRVRLVTGDTDTVKVGGGTHSGRGMRLASIIIHKSAQSIIAKGIEIACHLLDAEEISFADGRFHAKGTNRSVDLFEVAAAATDSGEVPAELRGGPAAGCEQTGRIAGHGCGCHTW